jgi:hypothetical protein
MRLGPCVLLTLAVLACGQRESEPAADGVRQRPQTLDFVKVSFESFKWDSADSNSNGVCKFSISNKGDSPVYVHSIDVGWLDPCWRMLVDGSWELSRRRHCSVDLGGGGHPSRHDPLGPAALHPLTP